MELLRTQHYDACIECDDKRCRLGYFNGTDRYWSEQTALTVVNSVSSVQDKTQQFRLNIKTVYFQTQSKYTYIRAN